MPRSTIRDSFLRATEDLLRHGVSMSELRSRSIRVRVDSRKNPHSPEFRRTAIAVALAIGATGAIAFALNRILDSGVFGRCLVPGSYLSWESTRPVSSCSFCLGVENALQLPGNSTRKEFEPYAYSSRPIVVKGAASHWPASRVFGLRFFGDLYDGIEGAYESVEEDCQFLHFKSDFDTLRRVFSMDELPESWYVGWKNCHPGVLEAMARYYEVPRFLPEDAEVPRANYVFLGHQQGAPMHLDYIPRLMWQAQLIGGKTWRVAPTPECDHSCKSFEFSAAPGDIVLLDTRVWYHATFVDEGRSDLTLALASEYG
ncbi:uncharacterized protein LOC105696500 [Orussus abietinus]|uniref:uncharacterized protein LOC105696500 n=1 Tax=Orussus abietinus TaxID=222816 RepID=UPI0006252D9D|nr:uncharacterized protein LOC105696500 [Orussus abietinus]